MSVYLDYNATAPMRPQALEVMQNLLGKPLNPSSAHSFGREAKNYLENARKTIAEAISAFPNEIIFTATGTEANATALQSFPERRLLVSAIEHSSVLSHQCRHSREGGNLIMVNENGVVDLVDLEQKLASNPHLALVSIMLANNETGVIQPIAEVSAICKKYGALLHCDGVQAFGKIPVDFSLLGVDMLTISAHKMGGAVGAAALVVRNNLTIKPLLIGGGQELRRRAGTENIPAIVAFAKAVELIDLQQMQDLRNWHAEMEVLIEQAGGIIIGKDAQRLPNTSCIAMVLNSPSPCERGLGGGVVPEFPLSLREGIRVVPKFPLPLREGVRVVPEFPLPLREGVRGWGSNQLSLSPPPQPSPAGGEGEVRIVSNELQLMDFDLNGFAVSAGSACSSGRIEVSHVLKAMGLDDKIASSAIRISTGWNTKKEVLQSFSKQWLKLRQRLI